MEEDEKENEALSPIFSKWEDSKAIKNKVSDKKEKKEDFLDIFLSKVAKGKEEGDDPVSVDDIEDLSKEIGKDPDYDDFEDERFNKLMQVFYNPDLPFNKLNKQGRLSFGKMYLFFLKESPKKAKRLISIFKENPKELIESFNKGEE